jgi:hypothetical protein
MSIKSTIAAMETAPNFDVTGDKLDVGGKIVKR